MLVEQPDQLAPHLAGQDHPDDLHNLRRCHPQAAHELAGQPDPLQHGCNLRTAAVDNNRTQPGIPQEDDVLGEGCLELVVDHGVAAVLDHDERTTETLEPRQRLDKDLRLGGRSCQAALTDRTSQVVAHVL